MNREKLHREIQELIKEIEDLEWSFDTCKISQKTYQTERDFLSREIQEREDLLVFDAISPKG